VVEVKGALEVPPPAPRPTRLTPRPLSVEKVEDEVENADEHSGVSVRLDDSIERLIVSESAVARKPE